MFDFSDMQCPDHSEQVCCLFCYSCGCLVCPTGVTEVHKTHELVEIEEAFRMRKEFLKIMKDKLKKQHEDWIKNNDVLNTLKETNNLRFEQTKKDILKQKQIWKEAADEYATELCDEINKQWRLKEDAIKTESSKVKYFEQHLTNKIQLIEDMSISMDVKKFFEDTKSFDNVTEMPNLNLNESQLTSFVPGDINVSLFGTIENEIKKDKIIRIEAIKEYTTELGIVTQIVPCSDNKLWIHESYPDRIQKISLQNYSSIKVLLQINNGTLSVTFTSAQSTAYLKYRFLDYRTIFQAAPILDKLRANAYALLLNNVDNSDHFYMIDNSHVNSQNVEKNRPVMSPVFIVT
ncbi:unnamed protein product [Mytilus edulis]|uniref:B box-type domain-containing protein n=1 Tax=Mytilus edulis TaxID=6550 RepID=A0A8S3UJG2_MYTED|nr:unnamed protein product [Mytilus edulis]